jgi:hypothetical protein
MHPVPPSATRPSGKGFDGMRGWEINWWNDFGVGHVAKGENTWAGTLAYVFSKAWWYPMAVVGRRAPVS